jgi:hypothetical protein
MNLEKEKKKTFEEHLTAEIEKSGYPLEIEISSLLDKEYRVLNTHYYFDEEAKKGRDIDIYAIPRDVDNNFIKTDKFVVITDLAIECKKSDTHAWIFYTRPYTSVDRSADISGQFDTSVPKLGTIRDHAFKWLRWGYNAQIAL